MAQKSTLQTWVEYLIARAVLALIGNLPRPAAVSIGRMIAAVGYRVLGKLRGVGMRNLELAFPEMGEAERRRILKASFASLGRTLGIVGGFRSLRRDDLSGLIEVDISAEFAEQFERIRAEKRGFVILTAHIGNWELFALAYSMFFGPSNLLSRRMDNPKIDALVEAMRTSFGNRQINKTDAAGPVLRILRAGESVGILADVNSHPKEGVFVPFFGIEACTTSGVALLAGRADALIVPLFAVWDDERQKYRMISDRIIEPSRTGDRAADIEATTAEFTAAIERVVRRYPEQWIWIHRRWKTRPPGEPELY